MTTWALMIVAIVVEVCATLCLRLAEGFSRPWWLAPSVLGYVASFVLFSAVLQRGWSLAVTYGVWAAGGICLLALSGRIVFGETLRSTTVLGMALAIVGIVLMQHGSVSQESRVAAKPSTSTTTSTEGPTDDR